MTSVSKDKEDMKRLIRMMLDTPYSNKPMFTAEEATSLQSYNGKNTDVKTRMLFNVIQDAMKGDLKAAEFLMKYGGLEPPKEANITVDTPTIIDDLTQDSGEDAEGADSEIVKDAVIYDDPDVSGDD